MPKKDPAAVSLGKRTSPAKKRAARRNGKLGGAPKWNRVSDKLPRQHQQVLAKYVGVYGPRVVTYWHDGVNAHFGTHHSPFGPQPATHWRKL